MIRWTQTFAGMLWVWTVAGVLQAQPLADRVPADAVLYVGWAGAEAMEPAYEQSKLRAVLDDANLRKMVGDLMPQVAAMAQEQADADAAAALSVARKLWEPTWRRPFALFVGGTWDFDESGQPRPRVGLVWDMADAAAANDLADQLRALQAQEDRADDTRIFTLGTIVAWVAGYPEGQMALAGDDGAARPKSLVDDEIFGPLVRRFGSDAAIVAYADMSRLMTIINRQVDQQDNDKARLEWNSVRTTLGLDGIGRGVLAAGFAGRDWQLKAFLESPEPRRGIPALLDGRPIGEELLRLVPRTATWLSATRFDFARALDLVRQTAASLGDEQAKQFDDDLASLQRRSGVDLEAFLRGLGDGWLFYTDPAVAGLGGMGFVLINPLDDAAVVNETLIRLQTMANRAMADQNGGPRIQFSTIQQDGVTIHSLVFPFVSPSWAVHDGRLHMALFPQAILTAVSYAGEGMPTILDNEKFVAMRELLGGAGERSLQWTDLQQTAPATYQGYMMLSQMVIGSIGMQTGEAPSFMLPPLGRIMPHLSPAGSAMWADAQGWHYHLVTPFPGAGLLGPQAGASPALVGPMAVGILLPALGTARRTARQMQSNTQLRGIHQAQVTYAQGNNGKFADDLAVLLEGNFFTAEYLLSPMSGKKAPADFDRMSRDERAQWVRKNTSYVFVPGLVDDFDTEKIAGFGIPEDHQGGERGIPVVYNDNHTVWEPDLEAFKAKLQKQTGWTMEQLIEQQRNFVPPGRS